MNTIVPEYYDSFRCIADKCKNNCCIGWEIDIDDDTYSKYKNTKGKLGKRLKDNIKIENGVPCFILGESERCPFLNSENLCDIIIECGEDALCEICPQHPRFHNYYDSRTESGIGLCCEEAARIILTSDKKTKLIPQNQSDEEDFCFEYRQKLFEIVQSREISIKDRMRQLLGVYYGKGGKTRVSEWIEIYLSLERLDERWTDILQNSKNCLFEFENSNLIDKFNIAAEQLIIYFLYRYTPKAVYEGMTKQWILFSLLSCCMIFYITEANNGSKIEDICNIARMYSAEIEYSDININMIFDML